MHFRASVIDDKEQTRRSVEECLRLCDFEVESFSEAERFLLEFANNRYDPRNAPDVMLVDLEIEQGQMRSLELIDRLIEINIPSEILVTSASTSLDNLAKAARKGAVCVIPKPFYYPELVKKTRHLAEIGRKRRLRRISEEKRPNLADRSRAERPVFISYASRCRDVATAIRRHLEAYEISVWYAHLTVDPGDPFRREIQRGIDQAKIFVAILSDDYVTSPYCQAELTRFVLRVEDDRQLLFLPVIDCLSDEARTDEHARHVLDEFHCIDFSNHFMDGLTTLLLKVQVYLEQTADATSRR